MNDDMHWLNTWIAVSGGCLTMQKRGGCPWVARLKGFCTILQKDVEVEETGNSVAAVLQALMANPAVRELLPKVT